MIKRPWSDSEKALLRAKYPDTSTTELAREMGRTIGQLHQAATRFGLKKSAAYMAGPHAFLLRRENGAGSEHRFKAGIPPWNKGLKGVNGHSDSCFKPGHRPQSWRPIGSERTMKGYLQQKVTDTGEKHKDWVGAHVQAWTEANGPVPDGHVVAFKDGDKQKREIENLEVLTRRELLERNSVQRFPEELRELIHLKGVLTRRINDREEQAE